MMAIDLPKLCTFCDLPPGHLGIHRRKDCTCGAPVGGNHYPTCPSYEPPLTDDEKRRIRELLVKVTNDRFDLFSKALDQGSGQVGKRIMPTGMRGSDVGIPLFQPGDCTPNYECIRPRPCGSDQ